MLIIRQKIAVNYWLNCNLFGC
uniref:Uncharacterized protein n=1 Tax=Tetranychus urticae TaxID=32264 RepID=T1JY37_TETUR